MKFYEKEEINNPNILDEIFTEMHKAKKVPMSIEQTKYMMSVMMSDNTRIEAMYSDLSKTFPIGGFMARCGIFPIKYEKKLLIWLSLMTMDFGIGGMILVGYYVQWWAFHTQQKYVSLKNEIEQGNLSMDTVIEKLFPFGVFDKETINEFLDKQKVKATPDNLIDHKGAGLSFMPIAEQVQQ